MWNISMNIVQYRPRCKSNCMKSKRFVLWAIMPDYGIVLVKYRSIGHRLLAYFSTTYDALLLRLVRLVLHFLIFDFKIVGLLTNHNFIVV